MEIKPYTKDRFKDCVEIFISNQDKFFADHELDQFKSYLSHEAFKTTYFVLLENNEVIGCGGYEKVEDEIILTWGMVQRDHHGQGYGKQLTIYRLNTIRSKYPNHKIKIDTSQFTKGFYEKLGFKVQNIIKDGYKPGLDTYIMTIEKPHNTES